MELTFYKSKETNTNAKLTVQKTGRLGFSKGAIEMIGLTKGLYAKFGKDEDDSLFLVVTNNKDEYGFKISKAGKYYYISAKNFLGELGVNYKGGDTIIFDLIITEKDKTYKMNKRVIKKS